MSFSNRVNGPKREAGRKCSGQRGLWVGHIPDMFPGEPQDRTKGMEARNPFHPDSYKNGGLCIASRNFCK